MKMKHNDIMILNRKCEDRDLVTIVTYYMETKSNKEMKDAIINLATELILLGGKIDE